MIVEYTDSQREQAVLTQATPLEQELESPTLGLFLISFRAKISSLGRGRYSVWVCRLTWATDQDSPQPPVPPGLKCAISADPLSDRDVTENGLSSSVLRVNFDKDTNDLSQLTLLDEQGSKTLNISHDIVVYNGENDTIYDMRTGVPFSDPPPLLGRHRRRIVESYRGIHFSQVTLELNHWLRIRYRVMKSKTKDTPLESLLEVSMLAGPVPPLVNIVSRFHTNLGPGSRWFYDENGFLPVEGSFNVSLGVGYNVRPLVSRSWMVESIGNRPRSDCSRVFTGYSVDPRGVVSNGDGDFEVFWKRRNNRTVTEDTGDNDWWKQGNDKSQSRSSIWLQFDCISGDNQQDDSRWTPPSLPVASRQLSLQLAHDVVALRLPSGTVSTPNKHVSSPILQPLSPEMHVLSIDVKDGYFPGKIDDVWIDMHVESLAGNSSRMVEVNIQSLVPEGLSGLLQNVSLRSLTFLYAHPHGEHPSCKLEKDRLLLLPGTICSLRLALACRRNNWTAMAELFPSLGRE